MKFYHQLNKHDPASGIYGDCLRTVIGCLLDMEPAQVPLFVDNGADPWPELNIWLMSHGVTVMMTVHSGNRSQVMHNMAVLNPGQLYMLLGNSRDGNGHVVICRDDAVIHDPSWTGQSVVRPFDDGNWIIATLVSSRMMAATE